MAYEIEKKSLEAHVEICAERYDNLEKRIANVEQKVEKIESHVMDIKDTLQKSIQQAQLAATQSGIKAEAGANKTIITIGTAVVSALLGGIFTLIVHGLK
jgi:predicted nuclease with TOPRIM domain